ncbi:MAG: hypothetical protein WBC92_17975 [Terracidiphilus sp.]
MKRKAQPRRKKLNSGSLLIVLAVALFVLLLLLRMIAFVAGHGHHRF